MAAIMQQQHRPLHLYNPLTNEPLKRRQQGPAFLNLNRFKLQQDCRDSKHHHQQQLIDPYQMLQVRRDATVSEIRQAYKRLAVWHHPWRCRPRSLVGCTVQEQDRRKQVFIVLAACLETLMDKEARLRCDTFLKERERGNVAPVCYSNKNTKKRLLSGNQLDTMALKRTSSLIVKGSDKTGRLVGRFLSKQNSDIDSGLQLLPSMSPVSSSSEDSDEDKSVSKRVSNAPFSTWSLTESQVVNHISKKHETLATHNNDNKMKKKDCNNDKLANSPEHVALNSPENPKLKLPDAAQLEEHESSSFLPLCCLTYGLTSSAADDGAIEPSECSASAGQCLDGSHICDQTRDTTGLENVQYKSGNAIATLDTTTNNGKHGMSLNLSLLRTQSSSDYETNPTLALSATATQPWGNHTSRHRTEPLSPNDEDWDNFRQSSPDLHYTERETNRLFGGPLALLYRARRWQPFADPFKIFAVVFQTDVQLFDLGPLMSSSKKLVFTTLPTQQQQQPNERNENNNFWLQMQKSCKNEPSKLVVSTSHISSHQTLNSACADSSQILDDGTIVLTTSRTLHDRVLTRTETFRDAIATTDKQTELNLAPLLKEEVDMHEIDKNGRFMSSITITSEPIHNSSSPIASTLHGKSNNVRSTPRNHILLDATDNGAYLDFSFCRVDLCFHGMDDMDEVDDIVDGDEQWHSEATKSNSNTNSVDHHRQNDTPSSHTSWFYQFRLPLCF